MQITQDTDDSFYKIKCYEKSHIQINEINYDTSLILSPEKLITPWEVDLKKFSVKNFELIQTLNPNIFLFGTGEKALLPPADIINFFLKLKIGIEFMTTAAACRTFNVLACERRKVVAGLII